LSSPLKLCNLNIGLKPLVVDLDGTVLKSDLLLETFSRFVTRHPSRFLYPIGWLVSGGKCRLKAMLSQETDIDVTTLPYNLAVLEWIKAEKARGRVLVLATASYKSIAERVAEHLSIFDEVLATTDDANLKAKTKRNLLIQRYGKRGFDYVGNESADLSVWEAANEAWLVEPSSSVEAEARRSGNVGGVIHRPEVSKLKAWINALRLHQWLKTS
jgi:hypothetical protein